MGGWGVLWSDVPGHVSYVLIALSYWMTNVFWLRIIAVIGLFFEMLYFRMSGGDMHTGIGWDIILLPSTFIRYSAWSLMSIACVT